MTRKIRIDPLDGWHHVMNRGVDRQPIFFCDDDRLEFGRCLAVACHRYSVEVHAYCLMDNHFHLLLRCPDGHLSDMMQLACGLFATAVNSRHGRVGHLFADRFCSRLVTTNDYIVTAVRYIHRNALDVVGIEQCEDYRWSSHRTYLGLRQAADFVRTGHVLNWFTDVDAFRLFVEGSRPTQVEAGADARHGVSADVEHLFDVIDQVIAERSTLVGRPVLAQRRAIALVLSHRANHVWKEAIVTELGLLSLSALSSATARARQHLTAHPDGHVLADAVLELVPAAALRLAAAS